MEQPVATSPATEDPVLAVCCQGERLVSVHAFETGEPIGGIPVGGHPVHAHAVDGRIFVATMDERTLTVVEPDGAVERLRLGVLGPSHFAFAAGTLFVTCTAGDVVAAIDPAGPRLVDRIGVGAEPHEIAAHGDRVFVGSRRDGVITAIDAEKLSRLGDVDVGGNARIEGVGLDGTGRLGYAVDRRGERLVGFSPDEMRVTGTAPIGRNAYDLTITEDAVYVPARGSGTVTAAGLDLEDGHEHTGFTSPVEVLPWHDEEWVVDRGRARLESLAGRTVDTPAGAIHAMGTEEGVVLAHYDDDAVSLVHPHDGIVWKTETGAHPLGLLVV